MGLRLFQRNDTLPEVAEACRCAETSPTRGLMDRDHSSDNILIERHPADGEHQYGGETPGLGSARSDRGGETHGYV
jgi:hypothetical protein